MRTILTVAVLVCAGGLAAGQDKKFESKEGKFSAKFPGTEAPKTTVTKAGGLDLSITIVEKDKKTGFAVIYSDLSADVVKAAPAAKLLEGGEKGLADNFKAKVTKSGETKFTANGKDYPRARSWPRRTTSTCASPLSWSTTGCIRCSWSDRKTW